MKEINLYVCGGAATNIAEVFYRAMVANRPNPGFCKLNVCILDTSMSNLSPEMDKNYFIIKGTEKNPIDGSGKDQATNYKSIKASAADIFKTFPPTDLNLVLHSSGGGSGSVIGLVLMDELLSQGKDAIAITVRSTTCEKEVINCMNTIASYNNMVNRLKRPVILMDFDNATSSYRQVDAEVRLAITTLSAMFSGENFGIDSKDVSNFLNYPNVTKYPPSLCGLVIDTAKRRRDLAQGTAITSMITMGQDDEELSPSVMVGYHSTGKFSKDVTDAIKLDTPVCAQVIAGYYAAVNQELASAKADFENLYRTKIAELPTEQGNEDGFVL